MIATRLFDGQDQIGFARVTGDFNPMHLDPIAARRTLAGAPVVHGVHNLFWLLESISPLVTKGRVIATMRVQFSRMTYVGENVTASITKQRDASWRAKVSVGKVEVLQLTITFGTRVAVQQAPEPGSDGPLITELQAPVVLQPNEMEGLSGKLAFVSSHADIAQMYPGASRLLGPRRMAALGCTSRLIGMLVPGLHSIYSGLDISLVDEVGVADALSYEVRNVDHRYNLIVIDVSGGGLSGSLEAFFRPPPTPQAITTDIATRVAAREFSGSRVLIIGGSRGLGELTAKVIAAGGGEVTVTYATGKVDAEALAKEIENAGGSCQAIPYDVRQPPEPQLKFLKGNPTHLYYFATPMIFRRPTGTLFSLERFHDFNSYYVTGFYDIVEFGVRAWSSGVVAFYPSSTAVDERPANMTEYSMSKAAAEILCADINSSMKTVRIFVGRLPRLPTDQTASIVTTGSLEPLTIMLPIIREVQQAPPK